MRDRWNFSSAGRRFLPGYNLLKLFERLRSGGVLGLAGFVLIAAQVGVVVPAHPGENAQEQSAAIDFHIAAQPLALALEAYTVAAKRQVIYNGDLATGRQGAAVEGTFTPEIALKMLLEGSGLTPRYMASDAFVLVPTPADSAKLPANAASSALVSHYYGLVQAHLKQVLCADRRTQPGGYRLAVSFWIGADGRISRAELLSTTGAADRDRAVERALRAVTISAPPPAGFAQPVTLVVGPQVPQLETDCRAFHVEQSSAGRGP
ncbi:TonB family protein [Microbacteriaceae bacterium K1510]|nr:TonB family protein [Microbacteriaceae bacterium K1510]